VKTHFAYADRVGGLCGRAKRGWLTDNPARVDCALCRYTDEFETAKAAFIEAQEAAFNAQEPHTIVPQFGRVND
jgi:hypothetical protein